MPHPQYLEMSKPSIKSQEVLFSGLLTGRKNHFKAPLVSLFFLAAWFDVSARGKLHLLCFYFYRGVISKCLVLVSREKINLPFSALVSHVVFPRFR